MLRREQSLPKTVARRQRLSKTIRIEQALFFMRQLNLYLKQTTPAGHRFLCSASIRFIFIKSLNII
ncbi:hypothetical protein C9I57_07905 [Trinickia symbiotica]|uniref:Uncharacterized protein n=2 Tax=Trinickia symbiotica TaxID=863227 RepID=A0A2T3XYG8_9BURK|nr:hypothetical protein C9I57_07905 [Trinickia symbiotica]